ncbi:ROK family protein [Nonomuraea gerenzanensis]|uniref:ROK family protein n=1 Tax=Nonomuraea gerenzanensis TaxID=93944 RepID=UPI001CD9D91C|nr:ROK family protein [Nonomuraea gerenzanensis]UBU10458.1 ROK family protein [Nonomuraea gerenzanensis]
MGYVAAIDVGGTTMKGGFVTRDGTIHAFERRPTPRAEGPARVVAAVSAFVADLARPRDGERPLAVGLAVPGLVTPTHAVFSAAFGWRDVPVSAFAAGVDVPVALGHDVRSAGEAELAYGEGGRDVLYLPIGTGIAGAVVLSGELYGGAGGWAGQIGHIPVRPGGAACGCGQRGCLAAYASGGGMAARCGVDGGMDGGVDGGAGGGAGGAEEVLRRVLDGDARAGRVWGEAVEALALALATYTLVLDPAAVVIGGGVSQAGEHLLGPLREALAGRLAFRRAPQVRASSLGARAGLMGAGLLGWGVVPGAPGRR